MYQTVLVTDLLLRENDSVKKNIWTTWWRERFVLICKNHFCFSFRYIVNYSIHGNTPNYLHPHISKPVSSSWLDWSKLPLSLAIISKHIDSHLKAQFCNLLSQWMHTLSSPEPMWKKPPKVRQTAVEGGQGDLIRVTQEAKHSFEFM